MSKNSDSYDKQGSNGLEVDAGPTIESRIGLLSDRVRKAINGESIRSFSERSGLSEGALRNIMSGGNPRIDSIWRIADAAGVSAGWLVTGEEHADDQVADSPGAYARGKASEVDLNAAETIMESMVREGLIKKDRRTPIRQFISIYNDLGKEKPSREEIDQVVLEHLLDYLYQQLEGFAAFAAMGQPDKELNAFEDQLKEMIKKVEARLER